MAGDFSLSLKEAGSLKEMIFLTYLWVNVTILDSGGKNVTPSSEYLQAGHPDFFLTHNNGGCASIIYVPREHNSVTHHLARSSDEVCFAGRCQSSPTYKTHSHPSHKPVHVKKPRIISTFQLSIQRHLNTTWAPKVQFLITSQLHTLRLGKKSLMPLLLAGHSRLLFSTAQTRNQETLVLGPK